MTRLWTALAAALLLASLAAAEPIHWTYTATLAGGDGSRYVATGQGMRPDSGAPDMYRVYQGYTQLTEAANAGPQAGNARFAVGSVPGYSEFHWAHEPPPFAVDPDLVASLTITDVASGTSGAVSVRGTAHSPDPWLGLPPELSLDDESLLESMPGQDLTLGGIRYRVRFAQRKVNPRTAPDGGGWDSIEVLADVRVVPSGVPEPTTLALAAVGLAGVGLLRRRLRA